ncbi:hypothetical protein [Lactiplantibacillus plantarum]|nr:hypothetical protein [Lactiplantibacillus plantarum]AGE39429.1 Hypothetical protein zj316_1890 [Lactiplantibacillus plantarum ZJ316]AGL64240.2 hypothetical protein LBP_cg1494 [Lactiplantibacillus plantarum subsp. plantarum P-8]EMP43745.1 Hypothetical protein H073_10387 [Lactiplantibacillus plantarum UCMA 3037]ASL80018.1 hypothetical protein GBLP1_g1534 [Lactiplantibacillus plantarum]KZD93911.1 hypothetical protein FBR4_2179 [Lactiplantibacillus plantarum]
MIVFFDTIPTALPFKQTIHLSDHLGKKIASDQSALADLRSDTIVISLL